MGLIEPEITRQPDGLAQWIAQQLRCAPDEVSLQLVAGDASPRRYYRVIHSDGVMTLDAREITSCIAMVSPASENNAAFLHVASRLSEAGVKTPLVWAQSAQQGWFLLEDFGDQQLLSSLSSATAPLFYTAAFAALLRQISMPCERAGIPQYDAPRLRAELEVFPEWFLAGLLRVEIDESIRQRFSALSEYLIGSVIEQPSVWVHRDFHSRNLMVLEEGELGVIDFQDAVIGPITYDPVSLLKDCYIRWPRSQQLQWLDAYFEQIKLFAEEPPSHAGGIAGQLADVSAEQFHQWFDLTGLQRHLRVLGVFARLHLRDQKSEYLKDLPLVIEYVREALLLTSGFHDSVADFREWFESELMPVIARQSWYRPIDPDGWIK
jgi:aminoglycoside/choline kinase family phosphotransferase